GLAAALAALQAALQTCLGRFPRRLTASTGASYPSTEARVLLLTSYLSIMPKVLTTGWPRVGRPLGVPFMLDIVLFPAREGSDYLLNLLQEYGCRVHVNRWCTPEKPVCDADEWCHVADTEVMILHAPAAHEAYLGFGFAMACARHTLLYAPTCLALHLPITDCHASG